MYKFLTWGAVFLGSLFFFFYVEETSLSPPFATGPPSALDIVFKPVLATSEAALSPTSTPPPSTPVSPISSSRPWFAPKYIALSHTEANGIGYPCGYTTVQTLFGGDCSRRVLPLVDLQLHYLNNNSAALNLGTAVRYLPKTFSFIPGVSVYYNFRNRNSQCYHAIGVGAELLGRRWDFRVNGYIPVGHSPRFGHKTHHYLGGHFFIKKVKYNTQFGGFNAEVGARLVRHRNYPLYAALGTYYLASFGLGPRCSSGSSWGVEARLQPQYKDFVALRLSVSHDAIFHTLVQGEIILSLPLYSKHCSRRIYQPIQRHPIIPLKGPNCCWKANF